MIKQFFVFSILLLPMLMGCTSAEKKIATSSKGTRGVASTPRECKCRDDIYTGHWYKAAIIDMNQACRDANPGAPANIVADQCDQYSCECRDDIYTGHWYKPAIIDVNAACRKANPQAPSNIVADCD